jgi:hypothetical protein
MEIYGKFKYLRTQIKNNIKHSYEIYIQNIESSESVLEKHIQSIKKRCLTDVLH